MIKKTKLKNGTKVLLVPMDSTKAVTLLVLFPVGSRNEHAKINGSSHYIEHMMFKGTKKRPTTLDISRELDGVGAEYNAFTGKDHTGYYIKTSSEHADLAADMLSDMLFNSKFEEVEMERERKVIIEEIHMYEDNPMMFVEELMEQLLFEGNSLGWRISGTREDMETMKREEVMVHQRLHYRPGNMLVVAAGSLPKNMLKVLENKFGSIKEPKTELPKPFPKFVLDEKKFIAPKLKLQFKETEQIQLSVGFPAFGLEDKRMPALQLLGAILGGTMSSRLFVEVREKRGLCYFVKAGTNPYQDIGAFVIQSGLTKGRIEEAITVIMGELSKVKKSGVTEEELNRAKENIRGKIILALEGSDEQADFYGKQELFRNKFLTPEEKLALFDKVKLADIQKIAKEIFQTGRVRAAMIGPLKDEAALLKLFKI